MKTLKMWAAGAALASIIGLGAPIAAQASSEGSRNTAVALGAAAIYELVNHKPAAALVLGAGAAIAEQQAQDNRDWRGRYHRDDNWSGYNDNNWRSSGDDRYNQNSNDRNYSRNDAHYDDHNNNDQNRNNGDRRNYSQNNHDFQGAGGGDRQSLQWNGSR